MKAWWTENARRYRRDARRDPVENALFAVAALSREDRDRLVARWNEVFDAGYRPWPRMTITGDDQ